MIKKVLYFTGLLLLVSQVCFAQPTFPKLTGRVVDDAHILNASQTKQLEQLLADEEKQSSNQVVVVTIPSTNGIPIADYGYQLGRKWGIGNKEHDNGVLLIVAYNDKKIRIEVGYGLEGAIPDATAISIINHEIKPEFKSGQFATGIENGVLAILGAIKGEYKPVVQEEKPSYDLYLFILFVIVIQIIAFSRRKSNRSQYYRRNGDVFTSGGFGSGNFPRSGGNGGGFGGGSSGGGFSGGGGGFGGGGASGGW
ncbi:TPM domain-containing protein [Photobacterium angustum]|uniref:Methanol dehydrogenase n=1 Tax=Photobacterium angustum TaxID=661 RepID=A0A855SEX1_PHOAN|nr:TPM domain-containing protein [Photobacterium angustum]KJF83461.1 methanol dehydrogenase [Photobacterium damselae subsp. damselae]KJG42676.1 methanol dehydrogenase [Photobacterium angustum]KJG47770.1 methanol dehydrogenase [Photobacterium angustum]KJG49976.1 methanol dehydrogenase [Photobacterium angustum]KJG53934.1 methanol dehydrogenase [Photobacterium angustum]